MRSTSSGSRIPSSTTPAGTRSRRCPDRSTRRRSRRASTRSSRPDRSRNGRTRPNPLLRSEGHGSRLRHLREEAILRQAGLPLPPPDEPALEPERATRPSARERHAEAAPRLYELPQGRKGPASRLISGPREGRLISHLPPVPPQRVHRADALSDREGMPDRLRDERLPRANRVEKLRAARELRRDRSGEHAPRSV